MWGFKLEVLGFFVLWKFRRWKRLFVGERDFRKTRDREGLGRVVSGPGEVRLVQEGGGFCWQERKRETQVCRNHCRSLPQPCSRRSGFFWVFAYFEIFSQGLFGCRGKVENNCSQLKFCTANGCFLYNQTGPKVVFGSWFPALCLLVIGYGNEQNNCWLPTQIVQTY